MSAEDRPFQDFSEAELLELRRNKEKAYDKQQEEVIKWAQMGTKSDSEPMQEAVTRFDAIKNGLSDIEKEFDYRHKERALARERGQQSRPNS